MLSGQALQLASLCSRPSDEEEMVVGPSLLDKGSSKLRHAFLRIEPTQVHRDELRIELSAKTETPA